MEKLDIVKQLAALAQETRLEIVRLLVRRGADGIAAGRIGDELNLPSATLAFHLNSLTAAGLISRQRDGRHNIYRINISAMYGLSAYLLENCCTETESGLIPARSNDAAKQEKKFMPTVKVYDPAMCCSTGVCGPDADDELAQFAATLEHARKNDVTVDRYTLGHQPQEYVANSTVKALLDSDGVECLPLVFVNDELVKKGGYPSRAELLGVLGFDVQASVEKSSSCCGEDKTASGKCCA